MLIQTDAAGIKCLVIQIGTRSIEYSVTVGSSRRYTYFRFRADRTLEIVLPRGRKVDLASAIRNRQTWILKHFEEMSQSRRILDEDQVMFDGEHLKLIFEESQEREELLHDPMRREVIVRSSQRSRVRELVRRWFLRETSRYVVGKLGTLSEVPRREVPTGRREADQELGLLHQGRAALLQLAADRAPGAAPRVHHPARARPPLRVQPFSGVQGTGSRPSAPTTGRGRRSSTG